MIRTPIALLVALAGLFVSCSTLVPAPEVTLEGADPGAAWARHLATYVDPSGAIDFDGMAGDARDLELVVASLAGPRPPGLSGDGELAYFINAYNGLAMYGVLHAGVQPRAKIRFFYLRDFEEGGRRISLYDLENDVIRPLGEPRVHFALNCMVRSCPRLPAEPFVAARLDAQLDAAAREFFNDPRHVRLEPEERTVFLSAILDWYEEDFLAVAPDLIDYANRFRDVPIPGDWRVRFLDYDWTLNQRIP